MTIVARGFGLGTAGTILVTAGYGLGVFTEVLGGSSGAGAARRRLDDAMDALERFLDKRRIGIRPQPAPDASAALASFYTDQEAAERVAAALAAAREGAAMGEADSVALRAILAAARARGARDRMSAEEARRERHARNRWRAIILMALLMLS